MPNAYLPKLLQIRPQYSKSPNDLDQVENVLWAESVSSGTPTVGDLTSIATAFDPVWSADVLAPYFAEDRHYMGCVVTDWSSDTGLSYSTVGSYSGFTGTVGIPVSSNVAVLVSYSNGQRFRGGHFRTYLPYVGINAFNTAYNDQITSGIQGEIATGINDVNTALGASGVFGGQQLVLFRFRDNPEKAAIYPIAEYGVNLVVATQRRRLRKVPHT